MGSIKGFIRSRLTIMEVSGIDVIYYEKSIINPTAIGSSVFLN